MKIDASNTRDSKKSPLHGFLLIDKPAGMTSHDVVDRVRRLLQPLTSNLQPPKVGHAGTLDPFATGLLIVGVGRMATREMHKLVGLDKVYEAEFVLGASSDTDDRTGVITSAPIRSDLQPNTYNLQPFLNQFIGPISQIPPTYSAIKIDGKKMYEEARKGKPMEGKPRHVTIYSFELLSAPTFHDSRFTIHVSIHCSSGTYIRSLARDLGAALGGGGYVEQLRRKAIGPFSIQEAHTLESLTLPATTHLIPVSVLLSRVLTNTSASANLLSA